MKKKYLLGIVMLLSVFCQAQNEPVKEIQADSIKVLDSLKREQVNGLIKMRTKPVPVKEEPLDYRQIKVHERSYNSPGAQSDGKSFRFYSWNFEGGADSSMSTFGNHMSRFPDSDSIYKVSLKYMSSMKAYTACYFVGFFGSAAFVGVLTGSENTPSIGTVGILGIFGSTFITGVIGRYVAKKKMFKQWQLAAESYNNHLYADIGYPPIHQNSLQLSFGLTTNYPGIGIRLNF